MAKFAHMPCVILTVMPGQPSEGRSRRIRQKDGVALLAYGSPMSRASTAKITDPKALRPVTELSGAVLVLVHRRAEQFSGRTKRSRS